MNRDVAPAHNPGRECQKDDVVSLLPQGRRGLPFLLRCLDPFVHVAQGYFYGSSTLSQVSLKLETIWLREWTKDFMPEALKTALGIPIDQDSSG